MIGGEDVQVVWWYGYHFAVHFRFAVARPVDGVGGGIPRRDGRQTRAAHRDRLPDGLALPPPRGVMPQGVIWPDFCSAPIVERLAPFGLHDTRFRPVPVSCGPRAGADSSSPRHENHRNVASSRSLKSRKGLRRQTSSVLHAPSAPPAMALPHESPTVPVGGSMPNSPTPVTYTRPMHRAPWPERCTRPSAPPCEAAHDTACSSARSGSPPMPMAVAYARPTILRANMSAANAV